MGIFFPNHSGTHIDFPSHFDIKGKTCSNYSANFWEFDMVMVINISEKIFDNGLIGPNMFSDENLNNIEFLIIKIGYYKYRGTKDFSKSITIREC